MQYVDLGRIGMKISRVCPGMLSYGPKQRRAWVPDEQDAGPLIKLAVEAGINFFDTADVYSTGERLTGKLLKEFGAFVTVGAGLYLRSNPAMTR